MIIGVGCDIVEISRIKKAIGRETFNKKCFTEQELENKDAKSLAGLFAAKEAVSKSLGTGFSGFSPKDIEIFKASSGKPYAKLYGYAREISENLGVKKISISIAHSDDNAMAFAVSEGE
ncbi:MAG: holo-ACP synthase [Lachnospiraceae bacterium]|nr:holo-ACP synthase [Lachnospiraceae bacterium]